MFGMRIRPRPPRVRVTLLLAFWAAIAVDCAWSPRHDRASIPDQLTDQEFWALSLRLSEAPGVFRHSDNLVSNEVLFAQLSRVLRSRGGVYIGVGPEQNFTYIARVRPQMAFIVDIRQANRNLHLLYKALFEMSGDRVEFVSRLFSREVPEDLSRRASVHHLFDAFARVAPSSTLHDTTIKRVRHTLVEGHRFPLTQDDLASIESVQTAFRSDGPDINYGRLRSADAAGPSYRALMTATDLRGVAQSYLASDDSFAFVKQLQAKNLVVPVVGDFGGLGVIRRVGDYIRQQGGAVSTFYGSNVEVYLSRQQESVFCANLADLPAESDASFISSKAVQPLTTKLTSCRAGRRGVFQ